MGYTIPEPIVILNMTILFSFIALILAITIHEFAHALTADRLGDPTPRSNGRLTLNPKSHIDPIGTILLPLLGALSGLPVIGWAKPVPIDPYNLSNPKRDELIISLAGPASNLLIAITFAILSQFLPINSFLVYMIIVINVSLAIFNLLPIPPLDGSKILLNLLPEKQSYEWQEALEKYGYILLLALIFLPMGNGSLLNTILSPIVRNILSFLLPTGF